MSLYNFSISSLFQANARLHARQEAAIDNKQRLTWSELDKRVEGLSSWLVKRGISSGDRIGLLLTDGNPFLTILLACDRIGAIAVLLNWRLAAPEIAWILDNAETSMTFANPRFERLLEASNPGEVIIVDEKHDPHGAFETIVTSKLKQIAPMSRTQQTSLHDVYEWHYRPTERMPAKLNCVAISALAFAVRSHFSSKERLLSVNPLFHVVGMQQIAAMLACGGTIVFAQRDDDPAAILDLLHRENCTTTSAFPQISFPWLEMNWMRDDKMPLEKYTGGAGAGFPEIYEPFEKLWDCRVIGGYGQTEIWWICHIYRLP